MAMFNSYVKLPEGNIFVFPQVSHHFPPRLGFKNPSESILKHGLGYMPAPGFPSAWPGVDGEAKTWVSMVSILENTQ